PLIPIPPPIDHQVSHNLPIETSPRPLNSNPLNGNTNVDINIIQNVNVHSESRFLPPSSVLIAGSLPQAAPIHNSFPISSTAASATTLDEFYVKLRADIEELMEKYSVSYYLDTMYQTGEGRVTFILVRKIDEPNKSLDYLVGYAYNITNQYLRWNPQDYHNITAISIDNSKLKLPPIVTCFSTGSVVAGASTSNVSYNGVIRVEVDLSISALCPVDYSNFPFDIQSCQFCFVLDGLRGQFNITLRDDLPFITPSEWLMLSNRSIES
ncbi:hypothetical protein PRIPAC_89179, partial [Pristionchus pacificus]